MKGKWIIPTVLTGALLITGCSNNDTKNGDNQANKESKGNHPTKSSDDVKYPKDGVRGIYVSADATNGEKFEELTKFIDESDLNAMVIDVKDDSGNVTINFNTGNKEIDKHTLDIVDAKPLLNKMKEKDIYPIARIVTFKDKNLAESHPEWSFKQADGSVWESDGGDKFVNPFVKEVWDYNINVSKEAAKAGFRDIQYDYVRFPEAFENVESSLTYDKGKYKNSKLSDVDQRVDTISQFLKTARKELKPYGAEVSADVFGYAAMVEEAPDKEPYEAVDHYLDKETAVLNKLGDKKPKSRPWLQDFTARYLGEGKYMEYDSKAVEAQVQALKDHGINEYLLWNAGNDYSKGVDYTPEANKEKLDQNKAELKKYNKDGKSDKDKDDK